MTRLEAAIRDRNATGGGAFVPYVTAGLPEVDAGLLREIRDAGADALEIGVPFSDPVMDGGVIQEASRIALEGGFRVMEAFELVSEADLDIPVVLMTYLNPVVALGMERTLEMAAASGAAGFIVPDLPADEGDEWAERCAGADVASVFLAAPGTDAARLELVARHSTGFVYCVSTYGVTGAREELSGSARELVGALRPLTERPLLVGVGISTPEHATAARSFCDGVIVGSALVRHLLEGDRDGAVRAAAAFRDALG